MTTCCMCQSATLIQRENLRSLSVIAGVLDVLLQRFSQQQGAHPPTTSWSNLADLVALASDPSKVLADGVKQGIELADNIEKHWLGDYESLCLNCGFWLTTNAEDT